MNLCVVGTGYVGLVSGTCFAETGNNVTCVDIDEEKLRKLNDGVIPIYEPGLEILFERNKSQGRLSFTSDLKKGVQDADIVFLALPTPPGEDGSADLSYVLKVAEDLTGLIKDYTIVVNKSTVPVGTGQKVYETLAAKLDESLFDVVSNPEFLKEGVAVDDFLKPDRVVIGSDSKKALQIMHRLYEPFVRQGNPIIEMDIRSAEMTKYAANSYLAMRISFMNEVANLCDKVGANVDNVRVGIGSDTRIGKRFLFPGIGYGGSCFPKDVKALYHTAGENEYDFRILGSVMEVNKDQKMVLVKKLRKHFGNLKGKKISLWGLSFKPETDDIREAPSLEIIKALIEEGAEVSVFDPEAMKNVWDLFGDSLIYAEDQYGALKDADALVVATEWSVFRMPDFKKMKDFMKQAVIFDGRNVYSGEGMEENGFKYYSIGRPERKKQ